MNKERPKSAGSSSGDNEDTLSAEAEARLAVKEEAPERPGHREPADAPRNHAINIYARIRPTDSNPRVKNTPTAARVTVDGPEPGENNEPQLHFAIPKSDAAGVINNSREHFGFRFDRVFDAPTTQEEIFDNVAKPVVKSVLDGFNGTLFAYGQTGSGKTFTITGGPERYEDRGIIPRAIQYIFKNTSASEERKYKVSVSYLEIYNEVGYDLLDDTRDAKRLEDLPKVTVREDEDQMIYLSSLSQHVVANEEEALNWLFVGDTNKMIAETPSNPSSSRSHCIFLITVTSRSTSQGSETVRKSKLHLVDLAGSERVAKTGLDGALLREARHINLSLHHLELVIIALHEKALGKRAHVPYRNSMMTTILRDSLGGNCMTSMVATISIEGHLLEESISTCRFAQRVALISNKVSINEEQDTAMIIANLKSTIARLRVELAIARGGTEADSNSMDEALPEYEIAKCLAAVEAFLNGDDSAMLFSDYRRITACFHEMRKRILQSGKTVMQKSVDAIKPSTRIERTKSCDIPKEKAAEILELESRIEQRDAEIAVLIPMLNKFRQRLKELGEYSLINEKHSDNQGFLETQDSAQTLCEPSESVVCSPVSSACKSADATEALLAEFGAVYPEMKAIEGQRDHLKVKYAEARSLGHSAVTLRNKIKQLKQQLSQSSVNTADNSDCSEEQTSAASFKKEKDTREEISKLTQEYKQKYAGLRELKTEIDHLQHLLDVSKVKLNSAFQEWLANRKSNVEKTGFDYVSSTVASPNAEQSNQSKKEKVWPTTPGLPDTRLSKTQAWVSPKESKNTPQDRKARVAADIAAFYAARDKVGRIEPHR